MYSGAPLLCCLGYQIWRMTSVTTHGKQIYKPTGMMVVKKSYIRAPFHSLCQSLQLNMLCCSFKDASSKQKTGLYSIKNKTILNDELGGIWKQSRGQFISFTEVREIIPQRETRVQKTYKILRIGNSAY
jgi:hypothetical protein